MAFRAFSMCGTMVVGRTASRVSHCPAFAMANVVGSFSKQLRTASTMTAENKTILSHLLKTESDANEYYSELAAKAKNQVWISLFDASFFSLFSSSSFIHYKNGYVCTRA